MRGSFREHHAPYFAACQMKRANASTSPLLEVPPDLEVLEEAKPATAAPSERPRARRPEQDAARAMEDRPLAAVIGSGVAGIAAAIRLAQLGHRVTVFEANATAGGKVDEWRQDGFRWDMGPTILTMPGYLAELFALCGEDMHDHLRVRRLDGDFQHLFDDGTVIRSHADPERLADEFAAKTTVKRETILRFMERSRVKLLLTDEVFLQRTLHRFRNYFDRATWRGILNFHKVEAFTTMARANAALFKDEKVSAVFNQYASYNGSDPYQAPATLNLISHFEVSLGAYFAEGGMRAIIRALHGLAERQGVTFRFGKPVERIVVERGRTAGIVVNGHRLPFHLVVSNADVLNTYQRLMPGVRRPRITLEQPRSSSVIVFYWGMDRTFDELRLHNMFLSSDPKREFAAVFREGTVSEDPSVYLHVSCKANPGDAPAGHENWYAMITVPHNTGQDWDALIDRVRAATLKKLGRRLGVDLSRHILCEHVLEPRTIEQRTGSPRGAVFGNSSNGLLAAFLRHPNFSSRVKGLYFCGGSVHPGSSVPLCLLSAKIAAGMVAERKPITARTHR